MSIYLRYLSSLYFWKKNITLLRTPRIEFIYCLWTGSNCLEQREGNFIIKNGKKNYFCITVIKIVGVVNAEWAINVIIIIIAIIIVAVVVAVDKQSTIVIIIIIVVAIITVIYAHMRHCLIRVFRKWWWWASWWWWY